MDANVWLGFNKGLKAVITGLPDMEEVNLEEAPYIKWLRDTTVNLISSMADDGVIIFCQTNRYIDGHIIDKKTIISNEFIQRGFRLVLEKVVLKTTPGSLNYYRPTYMNMFGFSKDVKRVQDTPDIIETGNFIYKNAMGYNVVKSALDFIKRRVETDLIIDPFCGRGSTLKVSIEHGYRVIGIDILPSQIEETAKLLGNKEVPLF